MSETYQFNLPLLQAAQAQKHVTMNEALARLDALAQLRLVSRSTTTPPASPLDGQVYSIPNGATGDWLSADGQLAIFANTGWVFLTPLAGWSAWVEDEAKRVNFDGADWQSAEGISSPGGAISQFNIVEFDHSLTPGATNSTSGVIPGNTIVFGATGRVITPITGSGTTSWSLGVAGSDNRYGSGLGLGQNSYALGLTSSPTTYYSDTALLLTAAGGDFTSGSVRLALHCLTLSPPAAF